jgi:flavorubredoxin
MSTIYNDLHQFTEYIPPINLSLHQYLLLTEDPALIHTGTITQAKVLVPQIKQLLGNQSLKYIFISHFESDECGGLSELVKEFPQVTAICSEVCARQLWGFGIANAVAIKKPGEILSGKDYSFEFISYPSEMHLQEGLLFMETSRGIFFSSDLMFNFGEAHGQVTESNWQATISSCGAERIPEERLREKLIKDLKGISPEFIATGHGPCIKLK